MEELRLECLRLAVSLGHGEPVKNARKFYDFVIGKDRADAIKVAKDAIDALG